MAYRISFGSLRIGQRAREGIDAALNANWISEGKNTCEFERRFAEKFGWRHAIATSSGTDAGIVVWSAVREKAGIPFGKGFVYTPACAFIATANCLLASGIWPSFVDVNLDTLNMNKRGPYFGQAIENRGNKFIGFQFVATMGKPSPINEFSLDVRGKGFLLIGDFCEAHGATLNGVRADHFCNAAIYSFYAAHMIVAGEGGMICTDDDEIAALCRSIKCHGYGDGLRFDFARFGVNAKMNELTAAIGLEGLEKFDETFCVRRENRAKLMSRLCKFEDKLILYPDEQGEIIAPHAFCITLRNENGDITPLYRHLERSGIEVKSTFGSLPTQHKAFAFLGHRLGDFPIAERIGRTSLHFSCSEYLTDADIGYIMERIGEGLKDFR